MREVISIVELLTRLKSSKNKIEDIKYNFIDPESSSKNRLMVSIYNESSQCTLNGTDIKDTEDSITAIHKLVGSSIAIYQKYLMIKNAVNNAKTIIIPRLLLDHEDGNIEVSIECALMLNSKKHRDYWLGYLDRLASDASTVQSALISHQNNALSQDKIDRYVLAKMNSLGVNPNLDHKPLYKDFAKEYIDANKFVLLDPLNIVSDIQSIKSRYMDCFDILDTKIKEFNVKTKIWIDFDSPDFWGFV